MEAKNLTHRPKWYYRVAVGAFFFLQGLVFASWASRIPDVKTQLHLNDAELGTALFAIPLGQISVMALSGWLVSRFGSRTTLTLAALLYPGILQLIGLARSMTELFAVLMLFGMAANLHNISVNTQAVGVEKIYKHSIMAAFHGLWSFAGFVGGILGATLAAFAVSPITHFALIFAVSMGILLGLRSSTLPRDVVAAAPVEGGKRRRFRFDRYIVLLGCIAFGNLACEGAMFDWSSVYFDAVVQVPGELMRLGYVVFMCAMVCGRFTADRCISSFGTVAVLKASGLLVACGFLLAVCLPQLATATAGFALVGLGVAAVVPICYSLAGRCQTMHPSVALASVSTIGFFGFLFCPPVVGYIAHATSLRWSFALLVLFGLLTALLGSRLSRTKA